MNAHDFRLVILFMANRFDERICNTIWGPVLGQHFWLKWRGAGGGDDGTMRLFYDMSEHYLQDLLDYIHTHYEG